MSYLICADCGNNMGEYTSDKETVDKCSKCGSHNLSRLVTLSDGIEFHENIKGRSNKMPGKKKPYSEFQGGEEWSVDKKCYVDKVRRIDRANDVYYEKVVDKKTGEVIHECSEPLSQHFGHGSAKFADTKKGKNK